MNSSQLARLTVIVGLFMASSLSTVSTTDTFDYLMLSQEWPFSFCTVNTCNNTNKLMPLFNIHGLWPEHVSGTCQGHFNYSELQPIEDQLRHGWMDLNNPIGNPRKFWEREYNKHGRCATVDSRFATTFLYFKAALGLHNAYVLTGMLAKSGIVPGPKPVKVSSIRDALMATFGYETELTCVSKDDTEYLYEIRLCFEKDLKPRNCSSNNSRATARGGVPALRGTGGQRPLTFKADWLNPADQRQAGADLDRQSAGSGTVIGWSQQRRERRQPIVGVEKCNMDSEVLLVDKLHH